MHVQFEPPLQQREVINHKLNVAILMACTCMYMYRVLQKIATLKLMSKGLHRGFEKTKM